MIIAEPTPCTARAAISHPVFGASAQAAEAAVNNPIPAMNSRLRPSRSPSADAGMRRIAKLRVKALTVHSSSSIDAPRSSRIVFKAVVTTSMSSTTISDATDTSARTQRCAVVIGTFVPFVLTQTSR
jgi:hypothetical protein